MTDSQKLEEIIKTAIEGGWTPRTPTSYLFGETDAVAVARYFSPEEYEYTPVEWLLLNHDFAKAYWGEGIAFFNHTFNGKVESWQADKPAWQYHLQQCVLAENPISYYYEHK